METYGDDEKALPSEKTTYREQIIRGIENKWTGKVKIKGYRVKVKMNVIDGGELGYYRKDQKFNTVNVIDKDGTSATTVGEWKRNKSYNVKLYTGFKSGGKRTASDVRNTAAHEFGHVFGVEDAYKYEISDKISPKKDLMRWNAGVTPQMTKYDVIMVLRAFTYNKYQRWSRYDKMVKKKEYE